MALACLAQGLAPIHLATRLSGRLGTADRFFFPPGMGLPGLLPGRLVAADQQPS